MNIAISFLSICTLFLLGFYLSKYQENKSNEEKVEFWKKRYWDEEEKTTSLRFMIDIVNEELEKERVKR